MLVGINENKLKSLNEQLKDSEIFALDVALGDSINHIFEKTSSMLGNVSVIINIIPPYSRRIDGNPMPEDWDEETARDARICFLCCRSAYLSMSRSGGGSIINIVPSAGMKNLSGGNTGASVSGGILAMTETLAVDYAPSDVRVNAISLGVFKTDEYREIRTKQEAGFEKKLLRHIPLGRIGKPEEVAGVALFLASSDSSYITGVTIPVDGGYSIG
jgi:NAD(P)-dependent dehydrogenase (short-subunit alcohol dehydrogenase family)